MIKQYEDCTPQEKAEFDSAMRERERKEVEYYLNRGFGPMEIAAAGLAFKAFLESEERHADRRPFDKAPGFQRMWILGYLHGRNQP